MEAQLSLLDRVINFQSRGRANCRILRYCNSRVQAQADPAFWPPMSGLQRCCPGCSLPPPCPLLPAAVARLHNLLLVDLSDGVYILHYPVLVALEKIAGPFVASSPVLAFLLAVAGTVGFALLLHFILEKPAMELGRRLTRSREPRQA